MTIERIDETMAKIDIISGFLGAGKTTLIKKLIAEAFEGEKLVLIENEFGEIGIDGGFLKEAGIQITEMNSGCICCWLVTLERHSKMCLQNIVRIVLLLSHPELASCLMWSKQ